MNPRLAPTSRLARSVLRTQSDERLVELVHTGSDAAFEAIVARYRRPLLRHCARLVGDTDSEEAVQDALLRAHAALARGRRVGNVRAWLHVIAHNAALSILRTRANRQECAHKDDDTAELHDRTSEQREQLRDLLAALQSLPERQRDAIVLRELAGLSYEQIADRLGTSDGAVRQLLHRARDAVRDRLGALTGFEPLVRYALDGGGGGTATAAARLGALSGGCALTAKLCGAALVPATVVGTVGAVQSASRHARATTAATKHRSARAHVVQTEAAATARTQPAAHTITMATRTLAAAVHQTTTAKTHAQDTVARTPLNVTATQRPGKRRAGRRRHPLPSTCTWCSRRRGPLRSRPGRRRVARA